MLRLLQLGAWSMHAGIGPPVLPVLPITRVVQVHGVSVAGTCRYGPVIEIGDRPVGLLPLSHFSLA